MENNVSLDVFYKLLAEKYSACLMNCGNVEKMQQMTEILWDYVSFTFMRFRDGLSQTVANELLSGFDRAFSKFNVDGKTM